MVILAIIATVLLFAFGVVDLLRGETLVGAVLIAASIAIAVWTGVA